MRPPWVESNNHAPLVSPAVEKRRFSRLQSGCTRHRREGAREMNPESPACVEDLLEIFAVLRRCS